MDFIYTFANQKHCALFGRYLAFFGFDILVTEGAAALFAPEGKMPGRGCNKEI